MPPLLALSGPSSSGKTTLARLLRAILPAPILLIHEDDYYRPAAELPSRAGHPDWDSAHAIDTPALLASLYHARIHAVLPPDRAPSKEAESVVGDDGGGLSGARGAEVVDELRGVVARWVERRGSGGGGRAGEGERKEKVSTKGERRPQKEWGGLVILDGFLLLGESMRAVREACQIRVLLRASRTTATARRARRAGYATAEGFWEDPADYMDLVVWPHYVEEHGFLFEAGDVEGRVDEAVAAALGVRVCPGVDWDVERCLRWLVGVVMEEMDALEGRRAVENEDGDGDGDGNIDGNGDVGDGR